MTNDELLQKKLSREVKAVSWSEVKQLQTDNKLYIVDNTLDILDVAAAMASDDQFVINEYLQGGVLYPPIKEEIKEWDESNAKFNFILVPPYGLIQRSFS